MKECSKCGKSKEISEFGNKKSSHDKHESSCKDCNNFYKKNWYLKNRELHCTRTRKTNLKNRKITKSYVHDYLKKHPCINCGEKDLVVLDFDHRGGKSREISFMIKGGYALESVKKEIKKCDVRCANCHRRKTALEYKWIK